MTLVTVSRRLAVACLCVGYTAGFSTGFQAGRTARYTDTVSARIWTTSLLVANIPNEDDSGLSYAERSRPFRRDVFDYDLWVTHRSSGRRFIANLFDMFYSVIVRQLLKEIFFTSSVAAIVCFYNAIFVQGYDDFSGVHHDALLPSLYLLAIPSMFFTLTSPALSLLLVFKTNTSYQRWDEGRKNWGAIVNNSRTIMREGAAWIHQTDTSDAEKEKLICRLAAAVWLFPRSMTRHLLSADEDEDDFATDVRSNLRPQLAQDMIDVRHRPSRALYELSCAIQDLPLSHWRRCSVDAACTTLCDAMGSNERIFSSPVPRSYTKHTARFLELWLLLMPLTLYDTFGDSWNHWGMIPATFIISFFLLGIEELGIQLEEPFSVLPMHKITNGIGLSAEEHVQWMRKEHERKILETHTRNEPSTDFQA